MTISISASLRNIIHQLSTQMPGFVSGNNAGRLAELFGLYATEIMGSSSNNQDWQESVKDRHLVAPPVGPAVKDRYIIAGIGGTWSTFTINDIVEWDGSNWLNTTPNEGFMVEVEDEDKLYYYNGTSWGVAPPLYWDRTGTILNPSAVGDDVALGTGDLSATEVNSKVSPVYNVKLNGLVGNGTIDDAPALQALVNVVKLVGGTIYFPLGTYKLSTTIDCGNNDKPIIFKGDHRTTTILSFTTVTTGQMFIRVGRRSRFEDLKLDGTAIGLNGVSMITCDTRFGSYVAYWGFKRCNLTASEKTAGDFPILINHTGTGSSTASPLIVEECEIALGTSSSKMIGIYILDCLASNRIQNTNIGNGLACIQLNNAACNISDCTLYGRTYSIDSIDSDITVSNCFFGSASFIPTYDIRITGGIHTLGSVLMLGSYRTYFTGASGISDTSKVILWNLYGSYNIINKDINSGVVTSGTAKAFNFDTYNNLTTVGDKLLSLNNFGAEKFAIDKDGNIITGGLKPKQTDASLAMVMAEANAVRTVLLAHAADGAEHKHGGTASPDTVSFASMPAVCTNLATAKILIKAMLDGYTAHDADAQLATPVYHNATGAGSNLVSVAIPTTLAECFTRLDDLIVKYSTAVASHDKDIAAHTTGNLHGITTALLYAYSSVATDSIINISETPKAITVMLSTSDNTDGRILIVKDRSNLAATHNITVTPQSGLIDKSANVVISANCGVTKVIGDATDWWTL